MPHDIFAPSEIAEILIDEWRNAHKRQGWAIGRYVIMPDASLWQEEFFDHLLRSDESYSQKWEYVKRTRHGLASLTDPMSGHGKARLNR